MKLHRFLDPLIHLGLRLKRRPGPASGVLLVNVGGLGDTVMFAVVLPRLLRLARPGETVTVLLRKDGSRMAFTFPAGVQVKTVDFNRLREAGYRREVAADIHAAHYRLVVHTDYLRHPDLDEFLVEAARAPETAAMEPRPWPKHDRRLKANRRLYTRLFDSGAPHQDKVVRWARFAAFLTGEELPLPRVALDADIPAAALPGPTVLFQPFSAVKLKQSPAELWAAIAKALPEGWQARLAGHPSDLDKNPEYRALLDLPNVVFEGAPFAELAGIIRAARLVVSVDTACMHLAAALGTPTLCLASAAYVGEIVPYDERVAPPNLEVLYRPMECQGCLGACVKQPVGGMYPCVAALEPGAVLDRIRALTAA
jgi:ADP-heptose:LPS heptosyltransferase